MKVYLFSFFLSFSPSLRFSLRFLLLLFIYTAAKCALSLLFLFNNLTNKLRNGLSADDKVCFSFRNQNPNQG